MVSESELVLVIFTSIYVAVNTIVGLKIILKYRSYSDLNLLLVGIAWLGLAFPWIPDILLPIFSMIDPQRIDVGIKIFNYIIIVLTIPLPLICWIIALTNLLNIRSPFNQIIVIIIVLITIVFELILFFLFTDALNSGTITYGYSFKSETLDIFFIIVLLIVLISGMTFAVVSMKLSDKVVKVKGMLLMIAFLLFAIGAVIDALLQGSFNIFARMLLCLSSLSFYFGLIMPNWLKKKIKTEE